MTAQLPDFDRLLLVLFAFLLLKVSRKLYAPRLKRRWKRVKARPPRDYQKPGATSGIKRRISGITAASVTASEFHETAGNRLKTSSSSLR
jgi:hypothetical protein